MRMVIGVGDRVRIPNEWLFEVIWQLELGMIGRSRLLMILSVA